MPLDSWVLYATGSQVALNSLQNWAKPLNMLCKDEFIRVFQKDPFYRGTHTEYVWLEARLIQNGKGLKPYPNYVNHRGNSGLKPDQSHAAKIQQHSTSCTEQTWWGNDCLSAAERLFNRVTTSLRSTGYSRSLQLHPQDLHRALPSPCFLLGLYFTFPVRPLPHSPTEGVNPYTVPRTCSTPHPWFVQSMYHYPA